MAREQPSNESLGGIVGPPLEFEEFDPSLSELLSARFEPSRGITANLLAADKLKRLQEGERVPDPATGGFIRTAPPKISKAEALERAKKEGVQVEVGADGISEGALDFLIQRRREDLMRQYTIDRYRGGFGGQALGLGAAFLGEAVDPLNIAAAFIPIVGPARYAAILGRAGTGIGARAAARAGIGAAEGAVGVAALEPFNYAASQRLQDDYTLRDSLANVAFGTFLGAGLHSAGGAIFDAVKGRAKLGAPSPPPPPPVSVSALTTESGFALRQPRQTVDEIVAASAPTTPTVTFRPVTEVRAGPPLTFGQEVIPRTTGVVRAAESAVDISTPENFGSNYFVRGVNPARRNKVSSEVDAGLAARADSVIGERVDENGVPVPGTSAYFGSTPALYGEGGQIHIFHRSQVVDPDNPWSRIKSGEKPVGTISADDIPLGSDPYQFLKGLRASPEVSLAARAELNPARTPEEAQFVEDIRNGGEPDYINQRVARATERLAQVERVIPRAQALETRTRLVAERAALTQEINDAGRRLAELGNDPYAAPVILERVSDATKAAGLRAAIAQDLQGRPLDVESIFKQDPRAGYRPDPTEVQAFFDRQSDSVVVTPEGQEASIYGALRLKEPDVVETAATAQKFASETEVESMALLRERGLSDEDIEAVMEQADNISEYGERLAKAAEQAARICEVF